MNILMVFHFAPYPPDSGVTIRMFHQLLEVSKRHEVSVLAFGSVAAEEKLKQQLGNRCNQIVFVQNSRPRLLRRVIALSRLLTWNSPRFREILNRKFQSKFDEMVTKGEFDAIFFSTTFFAYYHLPNGIPLIGDTHNVEFDTLIRAYKATKNPLRKFYYFLESRIAKRDELEHLKRFDVVLTTSHRDMDIFLKESTQQNINVVPNGVDLDYFAPQNITPEPHSMVFTGLMRYYPNSHGMLYFLDKILPLILEQTPDAHVYIVGASPTKELLKRQSKNVTVTGYVSDVRPYIARSQISIIPILIGGGTRLKALEAMAMKKSLVTTTLGIEGINLAHEESALLADTPEDFAREVLRLFHDRHLRERLADNAHGIVHRTYGWKAIGLQLHQIIESVATKKPLNSKLDTQPLHAASFTGTGRSSTVNN
jgi:sugar transferase (PEP-CTERM/EpsH1 system associated)